MDLAPRSRTIRQFDDYPRIFIQIHNELCPYDFYLFNLSKKTLREGRRAVRPRYLRLLVVLVIAISEKLQFFDFMVQVFTTNI